MIEIANFIDKENRIKQYPAKRKKKLYVLYYLVSKIENKEYSEKELNELLNQYHTFNDSATLRRDLCDFHLLTRDKMGLKYEKKDNLMTLEELINKYGK